MFMETLYDKDFYEFIPHRRFTAPGMMRLEADYHLLSGQVGIAFHF